MCRKTVNVQLKTGNVQLKTGNVQLKTGNVQLKTGNLQMKTGNVQLKTGNMQLKTVYVPHIQTANNGPILIVKMSITVDMMIKLYTLTRVSD